MVVHLLPGLGAVIQELWEEHQGHQARAHYLPFAQRGLWPAGAPGQNENSNPVFPESLNLRGQPWARAAWPIGLEAPGMWVTG